MCDSKSGVEDCLKVMIVNTYTPSPVALRRPLPQGEVREQPLSLYIHWPYCLSKCPYCDFNSHVRPSIDEESWAKAMQLEIKSYAEQYPDRIIKSIFWGGGTPSLISPSTVVSLLSQINASWPLAENCEITLEANPNSIEAQKFSDFKAAGITRVSVGIQALNDLDLIALGRKHSAAEARKALDIAFSTFDRASFDLIYTRENQTLEAWRKELQEALTYKPSHLSLYQLTLEPGTLFTQRAARGDLILPQEDLAADFYELTQNIMKRHGMHAYEVSNHARPGHECQHNLVYWRYGDFLGLGPGAHGRIGGKAIQNIKAPEMWQEAVTKVGRGVKQQLILTSEEIFSEFFLMGLRLSEGINLDRYPDLTAEFYNEAAFDELKSGGFIEGTPHHFRATAKGRLCLNQVVERLIFTS